MVDWRKTFAPQSENWFTEFYSNSVSLDELYCREFLQGIPGMVDRTLSLKHLTLTGLSDSESFVYLREAANCYILGLTQSAVALARAAIEHALTKKLEKSFGANAIRGTDLKVLIKDYAARGNTLSREGRSRADKVRMAGNDVLHQQTTPALNALDIIEAARSVIIELAGPKAANATRSKGS